MRKRVEKNGIVKVARVGQFTMQGLGFIDCQLAEHLGS